MKKEWPDYASTVTPGDGWTRLQISPSNVHPCPTEFNQFEPLRRREGKNSTKENEDDYKELEVRPKILTRIVDSRLDLEERNGNSANS